MRIERIELHRIQLSLVTPFETSFGRMEGRQFILLSLHSGEFTGWGECTTQMGPWYSSETTETAWHVLSEFLVPQVLGEEIAEPSDIAGRFRDVIWHAESPIMRTAPAPLHALSALVNQEKFKVVLTGEGADEVFVGYNIFREAKVRHFWSRDPASRSRPALLSRLYPYLAHSPPEFSHKFYGGGLELIL